MPYQQLVRRQSSFPNIEEALSLWVENAVSDKVTLTDSILREKARKFAVLFNNREFGATNGWLEGFKKRNNLKSYKSEGKRGASMWPNCPSNVNI